MTKKSTLFKVLVAEDVRVERCGNCGISIALDPGCQEYWCPRCRFKVVDSNKRELQRANAGFIRWDGRTSPLYK